MEEQELPAEIAEQIEQSIRDGVSLQFTRGTLRRRQVTQINWRPGDPNKLVEIIIKHVHHPMELNLDGHTYRIEPSVPRSDTA